MRGAWIAIDGTDAVGKTTQLALLAEALRLDRHDVNVSPEFSNSSLGAVLRRNVLEQRFLSLGGDGSTPWADTLALLADLAFKVESGVLRTLEGGGFHLSDRGLLSLCAYQAYRIRRTGDLDVSSQELWELVMSVTCHLRLPDLHILLTGSIPTLEARALKREGYGWSANDRDFISSVQDEMISLAGASAINTIVHNVDGKNETTLHQELLAILHRDGHV